MAGGIFALYKSSGDAGGIRFLYGCAVSE